MGPFLSLARTSYNSIFATINIVFFAKHWRLAKKFSSCEARERSLNERTEYVSEDFSKQRLSKEHCLRRSRFPSIRQRRIIRRKPYEAEREITKLNYPCLCLCLGFSQITITRPCLLITLHLSHIGLTEALTFIFLSSNHFSLHVILPRVRSYGESSTFTLSPGRIRM